MRITLHLLWLIPVTGILSSCIAIPIPHRDTPYSNLTDSRVIEASDTAFLAPGVTTRQNVLLHLGEPDVWWDDERVFAYRWKMSDLRVLMIVFAGYNSQAGEGEVPHRDYLLVQFDEKGCLKRWAFEFESNPIIPVLSDADAHARWRSPSGE